MKSLGTALKVLAEFTGPQATWGVGELAKKCALPKSQISKVLSTFREHGLLVKDPVSQRYSVGIRAYTLGSRYMIQQDLVREALPIMHALVEKTGHSVRLSVIDRGDVIYLLSQEGPLLVQSGWRAGTVLPWHATSAGRVLLAFFDEAEQDAILERTGLPAITPYTVTDRASLRAILARVRERGYASARNESTLGLGALSVPILGKSQRVIGALSITFPEHLLPEADEPHFVGMLQDSARVLSLRSGSPVYSFQFGNVTPGSQSA